MAWSSFPAEHKKRCYQGLIAYALLVAMTAAWISVHARDTVREWQERAPVAIATVKNVYLTPQIEDTAGTDLHTGTTLPPITDTSTYTPPPIDNGPVVADGKIRIALVMTGLGLSAADTERALNDLPPAVALAFSPYAANVQAWIRKASSLGHETLIQMPMETASYPQDDPGPRAISSRFSDKDNDDNLKWVISQGSGAIGVINMMGSRFLTDQRRLSPVFNTLRKNKSMFIETPGIKDSVAAATAGEARLPYLAADLQIDASVTNAEIRQQLADLEKIAHDRGTATGIVSPYPLTFNLVKSWAAGLQARGVMLVPLDSVWKHKPRNENEEESPKQPPQQQLRQP